MKQLSSIGGSWYFLGIVLSGYLIYFFVIPQGAINALLHSLKILTKLLPIIAGVIFLLAIFNYLFKPKSIVRHLGDESGLKGWFIAVFGGILSHGPSYIWYPILADLRSHGAKEGLIVAFIYVRAIKLPWLPVMIDYFGWRFTLVLSLTMIVAGIVQGMIMDCFF